MSIWLSKNFRRSEFACPCCGQCKIEKKLIEALQMLRDYLGTPIIINSGYRCKLHNEKIGGVRNSQHLRGTAVDCRFPGRLLFDAWLAAEKIAEFSNGGIGVYPKNNFIHLDVRGRRARWGKAHGEYIDFEIAVGMLKKGEDDVKGV